MFYSSTLINLTCCQLVFFLAYQCRAHCTYIHIWFKFSTCRQTLGAVVNPKLTKVSNTPVNRALVEIFRLFSGWSGECRLCMCQINCQTTVSLRRTWHNLHVRRAWIFHVLLYALCHTVWKHKRLAATALNAYNSHSHRDYILTNVSTVVIITFLDDYCILYIVGNSCLLHTN